MSASAQCVRLTIMLEPEGLLRILDRLSVLSHMPREMVFEKKDSDTAQLSIALDPILETERDSLVERLRQIPVVTSVEIA